MLSKKLAEITLDSKKGGVNVHPGSVKSEHKSVSSSHFVYLDAIKTSKVYVRDVTTVSPLMLALFGGRIKVYEKQGALTVDGWLHFKATPVVMRVISRLREKMETAFTQKVLDPLAAAGDEWLKCLALLEKLVGLSTTRSASSSASAVVVARGGGGEGRQAAVSLKPGDWVCSSCQSHNFASRSRCFRCSKGARSDNP